MLPAPRSFLSDDVGLVTQYARTRDRTSTSIDDGLFQRTFGYLQSIAEYLPPAMVISPLGGRGLTRESTVANMKLRKRVLF